MACNSCGRCNSCNSCGNCGSCGSCGNVGGRRGCNCLANDIEKLINDIKKDAEVLGRRFDELEDRGCIRGTRDDNDGCGCNRCGCNRCRRCGCNRCGCGCGCGCGCNRCN